MSKVSITANKLIKQLSQSGNVRFENYEVSDQFTIHQKDVKCNGIEFINCEFNEGLNFSEVTLAYGLKFIGCDVNEDVLLDKCSFNSYSPTFNSTNSSFFFQGGRIKGDLKFRECSNLDRGILLTGKPNIERFLFLGNKISHGSIRMNSVTINDRCDIEHNIVSDAIAFENSSLIQCKTRIWNNVCGYLSFLNSEFKEDVHVGGGTMKRVTFNNGVYYDDFNIGPFKSDEQLTIIGAEFKTKLSVKYDDDTNRITGGCPKIYLSDSSFGIGLNIGAKTITNKLPPLNSVMIVANEKLVGDISFRNLCVEEFTFHGNNTKARIQLHNIQPLRLGFFEFTNSSKIQFFDFSPIKKGISVFEISQSNLGQTEFYNAFLNQFTEVRITNSVLSEIITSNIRWFDPKLLEPEKHVTKLDKNFSYRNNRETFRQLKYAMEKQGNKIYALQFKSYEMQAYKSELRFKPGKKWYTDASDKVILFLNGISNSHGTNPLKAFIFIIGSTLAFYWLIVICISPLTWKPSFSCDDWAYSLNKFAEYSSALPKMLNPLFVFDKTFIDKQDDNFSTSIWVLFHRIILSYLLFQFVSAFRKFVK